MWFKDEAVAAWATEPRTARGGQPWYSALAILTALTLRAVFRLAYRQAEGLVGSIIGLLGLALRGLVVTSVPEVPIWKAFIFSGLHFGQCEKVLI